MDYKFGRLPFLAFLTQIFLSALPAKPNKNIDFLNYGVMAQTSMGFVFKLSAMLIDGISSTTKEYFEAHSFKPSYVCFGSFEYGIVLQLR